MEVNLTKLALPKRLDIIKVELRQLLIERLTFRDFL
jgi:hypothetical protein